KFREHGQAYFDRTWENAEYDVRAQTYARLKKQGTSAAATRWSGNGSGGFGANGASGEGDVGGRPTITVDSEAMPVAETLSQITDCLLAVGDCFQRTDQLVSIVGETIHPVLSHPELAGLLNQHTEFVFLSKGRGEYKPLPQNYANTWLNQRCERE